MRNVYLDHAATTYLDSRVRAAMEPYWEIEYGNPSGLYRTGRRAKDALEHARTTIAHILNAYPDEIIFTGGGSEALNLGILGAMKMHNGKGRHVITTKIEHHAVLHACEALAKDGCDVTYLDVDEDGCVRPDDVRKAIRPDTVLVAVMYANNEIGTVEPIADIAKGIKDYRSESANVKLGITEKTLFFLTDACQAAGALDLDVKKLGVDMLAINASKIYGPKGVGCLYVRRGVRIAPLIYGGGQERSLRSGTENVPGIIGFAEALRVAHEEKESENERLTELRDYFIGRLFAEIPKVVLNGHPTKRLPNNINVSVLDIEGEAVILYLDSHGIAIATGSACTSTTLDPSHVILALGRPYEYAHGSLRFTLGRRTTKEDLDYVMTVLPEVVSKLRAISPVRMEVGQQEVSHPEAFAGQGSRVKVHGKNYK
ncbi:MAG: hypothetical protein A3I44_05625 [Candidatus Sungbacteria bacterium RIFCSPLOWO2_02_FULL_51_17]|uniref:Aminotransferase class V domain-containing protein n=1 Tax=Candidatus Sungbacteria bacterium RIFCSPHIGHO2_02_FULL_51_29 TaxID=1802273 RepID=A0A1G2KV09_9BACT|nr:MAG: hypothetical protein A3C16_03205 [Candidatus Sungbacteria bacterium RIFCSPHIGHO2_02_FULL_51_29]OHA11745.1 MAG: hypothetical protein A3I44_05625 [Candidatus Sungbacteria bacterium RIFCSPLOWO2_02_FULL_51_17]